MNKIKNFFQKNFDIVIFTLIIFLIFFVVLLVYYPGILVSDSISQWNEAQTGLISDWHPAYNTIYIMLLCKIINSPFFVLSIQCVILAFSIGYFLSRLHRYYGVKKWYLCICAFILAVMPLNFNSAVILLKDTLYTSFIVLLTSYIFDIVNDEEFFKKKISYLKISLVSLLTMLTRHNGIYAIILFSVVLLIVYHKQYKLYIALGASILVFLLMTNVGFQVLNIKKGNIANKYAPVSHVLARILKEKDNPISQKEKKILSKYVNLEGLVNSFEPYNMDLAIAEQNSDKLRESGNEYLKTSMKIMLRYPFTVVKHYLVIDSFLYSPVPIKGSWFVGMFIETNLWIYDKTYAYLNEHSLIPGLLPIVKKVSSLYQSGLFAQLFMRPAIYMYLSIGICIGMSIKYKNKKILLLFLMIICNTASIALAMPVPMTRYVYSTILVGDLLIVWCFYDITSILMKKIKEKRNLK